VERLLNQREAAEKLGISVRTLERLRVVGTGPEYYRLGRLVRYRECDIEEWVLRTVQVSSSEVFKQFAAKADRSREAA
jgi:predicted DNA-binding transcriptional regulator AlpA